MDTGAAGIQGFGDPSGGSPGGGTIGTGAVSEKSAAGASAGSAQAFSPDRLSYDQAVASVQREWIAHTMKKHGGNKTKTAEELDIDRKTLNSMIVRLGMHPDDAGSRKQGAEIEGGRER